MEIKDYLCKVRVPSQTVNPLFNYLGVVVEEINSERARLRLPVRHGFIQGAGIVAGGVLATIADEAMAHVVLANLDEGESTTTIEMNMRYLRSIKEGEIYTVARIVRKGRHIVTAEADILDGENRLLAKAGASFMILR
ncbi:MAG: PaaI family thioesterase [Candidatus Bathyarchaeia archaeon]|nr:PaaI family thioesterase [Candidatus Bathyarchaeota archaeon]